MSNQCSHWPKATALAVEAFHHPLSCDYPPFSVKPVTLSPGTPQYISILSPFPILPGGLFTLLSLHSQFKISKTIKIPGSLQFAGLVTTFEFLLILLLTGHLLFCTSYIFSYHDAYMACAQLEFSLFEARHMYLFYFALTVAYHNG